MISMLKLNNFSGRSCNGKELLQWSWLVTCSGCLATWPFILFGSGTWEVTIKETCRLLKELYCYKTPVPESTEDDPQEPEEAEIELYQSADCSTVPPSSKDSGTHGDQESREGVILLSHLHQKLRVKQSSICIDSTWLLSPWNWNIGYNYVLFFVFSLLC